MSEGPKPLWIARVLDWTKDRATAFTAVGVLASLAFGAGNCWIANRADERATIAMNMQQQMTALSRSTLQADDPLRLLIHAQQKTLRLTNLSRVPLSRVEIRYEHILYSSVCDAAHSMTTGFAWQPWKTIPTMDPGTDQEFEIDFSEQTPSRAFAAFPCESERGAPPCTTWAPCLGALYVNVRALHGKTFEQYDPVDSFFLVNEDGTLVETAALGRRDGPRFIFKEEPHERLFTKVARMLAEGEPRRGPSETMFQPFFGLTIWEATGVQPPGEKKEPRAPIGIKAQTVTIPPGKAVQVWPPPIGRNGQ